MATPACASGGQTGHRRGRRELPQTSEAMRGDEFKCGATMRGTAHRVGARPRAFQRSLIGRRAKPGQNLKRRTHMRCLSACPHVLWCPLLCKIFPTARLRGTDTSGAEVRRILRSPDAITALGESKPITQRPRLNCPDIGPDGRRREMRRRIRARVRNCERIDAQDGLAALSWKMRRRVVPMSASVVCFLRT